MRIGIISLMHESNTFISVPTTLANFQQEILLTGNQIVTEFDGTAHEIGGFLSAIRDGGEETVPIFAAWATPSGVITADAYDTMLDMIIQGLDCAGPLDGLLVAPHGAAVSQVHQDMDGHWLDMVRDRVGPNLPIVCTLDAHANLSRRMLDACNATIVYRTNPHIDQRQIGIQAAELLLRTIRGQVQPTQAASFAPLAINIERQETAKEPCKSLYIAANRLLTQEKVLSNSVVLGFMYSDVAEMGTSFIAVTDNDAPLAQKLADELADFAWHRRSEFVAHLCSIDDAIDLALKSPSPVCLLDMGDNVGGGSPADGTLMAHALAARRLPRTFVCIYDPQAVQKAEQAGIGQHVELTMGGQTDPLHGEPITLQVTVQGLYDGKYTELQVRHGGKRDGDMGRTAVVQSTSGLTIQLTSYRTAPFSLQHVRCCDLDPAAFELLVAKGVVAPMAAYAEVCKTFIRVNTPGVTSADLSHFDYKHRRQPLFPFEDDDTS